MMKVKPNQKGFTVLELMIATVIFAVLLLGATTMIVQIGRLYYKGVVSARTQEVVRTVTDDIGRALQFGSDAVVEGSPVVVTTPNGDITVRSFCIGSVRYSYMIDGQVSNDETTYQPGEERQNYVPHALWRDVNEADPACTPVNLLSRTPTPGGQEMLGEGMRLIAFGAPQEDDTTGIASFTVGVVYGADNEVVDFSEGLAEAKCKGSGLGAQWCARSLLETSVFRRIN